MRRPHTILVMIAMLAAAGSLWPWPDRYRYACAALAFALIGFVAFARVRGHYQQVSRDSFDDAWAKIDRIRAERAKRFRR